MAISFGFGFFCSDNIGCDFIDKKFEGIVNCDHIKNWYIKNQFNSLIYSLLDKLK